MESLGLNSAGEINKKVTEENSLLRRSKFLVGDRVNFSWYGKANKKYVGDVARVSEYDDGRTSAWVDAGWCKFGAGRIEEMKSVGAQILGVEKTATERFDDLYSYEQE